ncbi:hypothetical protein [Candidatus Chloroploca sp. Khr17]|uniref:hypothetical protein n=1 Tax=Candidatus Chloroploca sp. Khr17 TaxID=2496869 RepID=UPI0013EB6381|nr:hypothetical protein [Candidatus Chloroploca sp. Khr17]
MLSFVKLSGMIREKQNMVASIKRPLSSQNHQKGGSWSYRLYPFAVQARKQNLQQKEPQTRSRGAHLMKQNDGARGKMAGEGEELKRSKRLIVELKTYESPYRSS